MNATATDRDFRPLTDGEALLRAIHDNPADDDPRLVFADWLEENAGTTPCPECGPNALVKLPHFPVPPRGIKTNSYKGKPLSWGRCGHCDGSGRVSKGFAERAEFIRVQCELAPLVGSTVCKTCGVGHKQTCWHGRKLTALRRRERELWEFRRPDGYVNGYHWFTATTGLWSILNEPMPAGPTQDRPHAIVRRGFVAEVRCTLAAFMGGPCPRKRASSINDCRLVDCSLCNGLGTVAGAWTVCRDEPVEVVRTDREPVENEYNPGRWAWFHERVPVAHGGRCGDYPYGIPDTIWGFIEPGDSTGAGSPHNAKWYDSRKAALDALNVALLTFARSPDRGRGRDG